MKQKRMLLMLAAVCVILSACTENKEESPADTSGAMQQEKASEAEKETEQRSDAAGAEREAMGAAAENITETTRFQSTEPTLKLHSIERTGPMYHMTLRNEGKTYNASADSESFPEIMFKEEDEIYSVEYHIGEQADEISIEFWNAGGKEKLEFSVDDITCNLELPVLNFREIDFDGQKLQIASRSYQLNSVQLYENAAVLTLADDTDHFFDARADISLKCDTNVYQAERIERTNDTNELKLLFIMEETERMDWAQTGILYGDKVTPITGA